MAGSRLYSVCIFCLVLACTSLTGTAFAHPHVFVDASVVVQFNENGLACVRNHWVYDELYSTAMMASADTDKDGQISKSENDWLNRAILDPLKSSNYHNYLLKGSAFVAAERVRNFKASMDKGRLVLDFDVVFSIPVQEDYTMIVLVVSDPTNYIQITTDMENADGDAPESLDVEMFNDVLDGLTMFRAFRSDIEGLYLRFKKK